MIRVYFYVSSFFITQAREKLELILQLPAPPRIGETVVIRGTSCRVENVEWELKEDFFSSHVNVYLKEK